MIDAETKFLVVMGGLMAVVGVAGFVRAREAPLVGLDVIDEARRAEVDESLATASGLPVRLDAVAHLTATGGQLVAAHGRDATADLAAALSGADALREEALRKASDAAQAASVLGGPKALRPAAALRARRAIHDADVAVQRLETLAAGVADRAELLGGGRERVERALEEHEARLARIVGLSETESLRLPRTTATGAPGPLVAAAEALRSLRADLDAPHPALHALRESLDAAGAAMARLERDVERARWEAGRA